MVGGPELCGRAEPLARREAVAGAKFGVYGSGMVRPSRGTKPPGASVVRRKYERADEASSAEGPGV